MKMIFGKRQMILAALVVVLGGAIWVNWKFASSGQDFTVSNTVNGQGENYGDSQLVNTQPEEKKDDKAKDTQGTANEEKKEDKKDAQTNTEINEPTKDNGNYFVDTRLQKQKQRDETKETLQTSINSDKVTKEEKTKLTSQLSTLVTQVENENKIESLVKAKGFADCVVFLDGEKANIVVKSDGLSAEQAAQIKDILLQNSKVAVENIRIVEVK